MNNAVPVFLALSYYTSYLFLTYILLITTGTSMPPVMAFCALVSSVAYTTVHSIEK